MITILSAQQYWNCMVIGSQYVTNCEINVACSRLNCNVVMWVQGVDQSGNKCYTKQEFIHCADGITLNLLLKKHHFQYRYPFIFNQRHTNENISDEENIEQNSLQQGQVIRNTKKDKTNHQNYLYLPETLKKNKKKQKQKQKASLSNIQMKMKILFYFLPPKFFCKAMIQNPIINALTMLKYLLNPSTQLMKTMILIK